jgi:hypothetical protein
MKAAVRAQFPSDEGPEACGWTPTTN